MTHAQNQACVAALLCATVLVAGCASAERQREVRDARTACYDISPSDAYQEAYALLSSKYGIARESERRAFIETEATEETTWGIVKTRTAVSAEILGESCLRIVMRAKVETYDNKSGEWSPSSGEGTEDDLYVALHNRLRARLMTSTDVTRPAGR